MPRKKQYPFKFNQVELVTRNVSVFASTLKEAEEKMKQDKGIPHAVINHKPVSFTRIMGSWNWKKNRKIAK